MKALISTAEQGSEQWLRDRIGYVTASKVSDVMAKGSGASRMNYMIKLICEILNGQPTRGYKSHHMQDGEDREPFARNLYQEISKEKVEQTGFWYLPDEKLGASSDGLVNDTGLLEIKNVIPAEQVRTLTTGKIKDCYVKQMQTQLYIYDRQWVDFFSLSLGDAEHGELPDQYKAHTIRVERDEAMIQNIREEVAKFHSDLAALIAKLDKN
jgi:hypothetical protein